ncbi:MAG TPA: ABC transporter substrate-binding protein [Ramlibacter sp.]|uniref:substrate-binding periplasmic protein n=1 Tax=Ramlibacter sp. TaxID=1917967 RepID=UPI002CDECF05|nr:ABC transporter substrate-binding protein [Ramlibacter sp.]HVZ44110.1 ABC transporter substrate-binding protein [Ramlibacter sp.]
MKRIATFIIVAAASFAAAAAQGDLLQRVKQEGTLRVCDAAYPPYNAKDPIKNQWEGLDVDVAEEIAKALNVKLAHVDTSFATLIANLTSDRCDMSIAATYITPERAKQVAFTRPYSQETKTAFVPVTSKASKYADIDVAGKTIAVRAGTAEETYAKSFFKNATIKTLTSDATQPNFLDVAAGRSDAVFAGYVGGVLFLRQNPNLKLRPIGDKLLDPTPFAFMVPLGQPQLLKAVDDVLSDMERSGKLEAMKKKWLGVSTTGDK